MEISALSRNCLAPLHVLLRFALGICWLSWITAAATGDVVIYQAQGSDGPLVLPEGKAKVLPGGTISYQIDDVGCLTLRTETATVIKAPERRDLVQQLMSRASSRDNIDLAIQAAREALKSGLLPEFYQSMSLAWKLDPQHPTVQRLASVQRQIRRPLGDPQHSIEGLYRLLGRKEMKTLVSDHYVLLYDTDDDVVDRRKRTRAEKRLELLETVYRSYFFKFAIEGKALPAPKERLMVVLFGKHEDYLRYTSTFNAMLRHSAGFWSPTTNIVVFFDHSTDDYHRILRSQTGQLQVAKDQLLRQRVKGAQDVVQYANTMTALAEILCEQAEIATVSHEAIHQLAGSTGLIPREQFTLLWTQEGLASYFETPQGANWGGMGVVNSERLKWYRALKDDPLRSSIEYVVSDKVFDLAESHDAFVAAYGQAWALTHFLLETRFQQTVAYYQAVSEVDAGAEGVERAALVSLFDQFFGDRETLEREWRQYMERLRTDTERLIDARTAPHAATSRKR